MSRYHSNLQPSGYPKVGAGQRKTRRLLSVPGNRATLGAHSKSICSGKRQAPCVSSLGLAYRLENLRYTPPMRSLASRITVTLVLLICVVCPVLETFDSWDNTLQTGSDTEYALVVVALCLGVAYSFARVIFASFVLRMLGTNGIAASVQKSFLSTPCGFYLLLFSDTSPPPLALRI
jgi:hypothetical protein